MRTDKEKAILLRKQGRSYNQIVRELGMSKSTLSHWFRDLDFSKDIYIQLMSEAKELNTSRIVELNNARGALLEANYTQARSEALTDLKKYAEDQLFLCAITAYWGEGDKRSKNQVRITNTDPVMLLLFKQFLLSICGVPEEKIKCALFIYSDLSEHTCKKFWSEKLKQEHFHKTMVLPSRHKGTKIPYGICTLIVSNTYLKEKMLVWIDQLPQIVLNRVANKRI